MNSRDPFTRAKFRDPFQCAESAGRSGADGRKEVDAGAQGGGGQGNGPGDDLLPGVDEQVGSYPDIGEIIAKSAGAVDERQVDVSHNDKDIGVAGGGRAVGSHRTEQDDPDYRLMVTAQVSPPPA